ncbi:MAG: UvrD-helicase domain-containing protein, partial [Sphaerochaetaceae bacterium]|nr:UvrD-helicase domain-containing protein [Sphaerochaetaceae bacterium]
VRRIFRSRYRFIMIDEFQDNNSLQKDLLFLLSEREDAKSESGRVPTVEELDAKKLFFVGDEKQSIYRFRGADVSVFRNLQTDIARNGEKLSLSMNYRSQSQLIDHFNSVFENVLSNNGESYAAQFEKIKAGRVNDSKNSKIIFATYNKNEINVEDGEIYDCDMLEAEAIGNYCQRILTTDEFLIDGRRPKPQDIAILFRTASNQMNIEKSLRRRNVPYQLTETRSLMLDAVAGDFYSFLQYLIYPEDKRSYVALLKSPFCGLCDESIFNLILDEKPVLEVDKSRYEAFSLFLEEVKEQAFRLTLPALLEKLYIEGGYYGYLSSLDDRRTFIEHYDYLYSYAISYEEEGRGLVDYVAFIRNELGSSNKLPDTNVLRREVSGVQIMTVHKSKGLEFPIVIFAGLGKKGSNSENECVFNYCDMLVATEDKLFQKILSEDEKVKEEAEAKRVMYVAMTRAEEHLISIGGYTFTKNGELSAEKLFKWYAEALGVDFSTMKALMDHVVIEDVTDTPLLKGKKKDSNYISYDFSDAGAFRNEKRRISVSDIKKAQECELDRKPIGSFDVDEIIRREHIEADFGTLCHLCLEKLIGSGSLSDVECSILPDDKDNEILLTRANAFAASFIESELYDRFVKGNSTLEELRFYTNLDTAPDMAVEGVIDLLVLGKDFNLVIDYKSDSFKDPEEHKLQVLSYIKVVKDLYPEKECYGTLYYLREGKMESFWKLSGEVVEL